MQKRSAYCSALAPVAELPAAAQEQAAQGPARQLANPAADLIRNAEGWAAGINATVRKVVTLGKLPVTGGLRYWIDSPNGGRTRSARGS